ncbi:hypothetical protein P261_01349 [Lachnospiraceae bacterium TWA4]|nr:hypothetical protein P261_01349 [Lachnospiraceae bacterium TWA4]
MYLNKNTVKLICELEYLVGKQCYNPKSYDGWKKKEGCSFRYPITFYEKSTDKNPRKIGWNITECSDDFSPKLVETMKYQFGSNHLFIGKGLTDVLEFLENRYGINFEELEEGKNQ